MNIVEADSTSLAIVAAQSRDLLWRYTCGVLLSVSVLVANGVHYTVKLPGEAIPDSRLHFVLFAELFNLDFAVIG